MRFSFALGLGAFVMLPNMASASPCTQPAWEEIRNIEAAGALGTPDGLEATKHYRACLDTATSLSDSSRDLHRFRLLETTLRQSDYDLAHEDLERLFLSLGVLPLVQSKTAPSNIVKAVDANRVTFLGQVAKVGAQLYSRSPLDKDLAEYHAQLAMLALEPSKEHQPGYLQAGVLFHLSRFSGDPSGSVQALVDIASSTVTVASAPGVALALRQLGDLSYARGKENVRKVCAVEDTVSLGSSQERLYCYDKATLVLDSIGQSNHDLEIQRERTALSVNGLLLQSSKSSTGDIGEGALALSNSVSFFLKTPAGLKTERGAELQVAAAYRLGRMLLFSKGEANLAVKNAAVEAGILTSDMDQQSIAGQVSDWLDIGPLSNSALELSRRSTLLATQVILAELSRENHDDPTDYLERADNLLHPSLSLETLRLPQFSDQVDITPYRSTIKKRYPEGSDSWQMLPTDLQSRLTAQSQGEAPTFTFLDLFELDVNDGDNTNIILISWAKCRLESMGKTEKAGPKPVKQECVEFCGQIWTSPENMKHQRFQYFQSLTWMQTLLDGQVMCSGLANSLH